MTTKRQLKLSNRISFMQGLILPQPIAQEVNRASFLLLEDRFPMAEIVILRAEDMYKMHSSGQSTCGICEGDLHEHLETYQDVPVCENCMRLLP